MGGVDVFGTETDQIGGLRGFPKVVKRIDLGCGIRNNGYVVGVGKLDRIFQRDNRGVFTGIDEVDCRCSVRANRRLELF